MKVSKEVWVIMDKSRKVIACGVPRNRSLRFVDEALNTRILTYQSEKKAIAGFTLSGFYDETYDEASLVDGVKDYWGTYLKRNYGQKKFEGDRVYCSLPDSSEYLEAVKATITIEV